MFPTNPPLPFGRIGTRMAYDAARTQLVLFGGNLLPGGLMSDTWTYDGTTWAQASPTAAPSPRQQHAMCYDSRRQRVVLFGGQSAGLPFGDTWEWNGNDWTQRVLTPSPSIRYRSALAFDGVRAVLFGGFSGVNLADTWTLTGAGWSQLTTTGSPSARNGHQMAGNGTGEVLLHGGASPGMDNQTWLLSGSSWTQQTAGTAPPVRTLPYLVHDPIGGRYLLFGGANVMFQPQEDTWSFSAGQWTQISTVRAPSTRSDGAAAWFGAQQRMVIQGGTMQTPGDLRSGEMAWEFGTALGSIMPWGPSICPAIDPPSLRGTAQPKIGATFGMKIESFSHVHGFLLLGFSTTTWSGGALPHDLVSFGTWPNCMLRVSPDISAYLGFGLTTNWSLPVPPSAAFVGTTLHAQGFTFGAGNFPTNLSAANAATCVIDVN